jgi:hypothetical protein
MPNLPPIVSHPPKKKPRKRQDKRPSAHKRGYDRRWQKCRAAVLAEEPICQLQLEGCTGWSSHVHHKDRDVRNLSRANLCGVCPHCHMTYHAQHPT